MLPNRCADLTGKRSGYRVGELAHGLDKVRGHARSKGELRARAFGLMAQDADRPVRAASWLGAVRYARRNRCKGVRQVSTVKTWVGRFVWHEQVSSDPTQAQEFYKQLFGWGTEVFKPGEVDYTMISAGGQSHGGFGKAMEGAPPPHWLSHVRVENVDETLLKVESAGGKLAAGPFEMGEVGRMAIVTDPQGAFVSLYQPDTE